MGFRCVGQTRRWPAIVVAILSACALLSLPLIAGCSANKVSANATQPRGPALPWPPPDTAVRQASDDLAVFAGSDYSLGEGHLSPVGATLHMDNSAGLAWAMYSLSGMDASGTSGLVAVNFIVTPPAPGSLFIAVANYAKGCWDIRPAEAPAGQALLENLADYVSPAGHLHAVLIQSGPSVATVTDLSISRLGALPPPPQNLTLLPEGFDLRASWDPVAVATAYKLWRSSTSSMTNALLLAELDAAQTSYADATVLPLQTYFYAVSCQRGDESPLSAAVEAVAPAELLEAPQNLSGTADVGKANLSWDPVAQATGYHIYRGEKKDFSDAQMLQVQPSQPSYTDSGLAWDKVYYYKVAAVRHAEGPLGNLLDLHVPAADLPLPLNFRIDALEGDGVTVAWDWDYPGSFDGFKIYFSAEPDFGLSGPFYHYKQINDTTTRSYLLDHLPPLTTLYVRLCAFNGVGRGRMTDDLAFTSLNGWSFGPVESIGPGGGPVACIQTSSGELACAFSGGSSVLLAEREAGLWTVSPGGLDDTVEVNGFGSFIDVAEAAGKYCICAFASSPGDLWASVGTPGNWDAQRVHGDGSVALRHPVSGIECKAAAIPGGFAVLHAYYQSGGDSLLLHTTAADTVAWSSGDLLASGDFNPAHIDLASSGSEYLALWLDNDNNDLQLGSSAGGWVFADVAGSDGPLGAFPDLQPFGGGWLTPAYDLAGQDLVSLEGTDASAAWSSAAVDSGLGALASIHLTTFGSMAMVIYRPVADPRWYYAVYNGSLWGGSAIILPGYAPEAQADLVTLGSDPYFVFCDGDNIIKAARANPPV